MMYDILFTDNDEKGRETLDMIRVKLVELQENNLLRDGQTPDTLMLSINVTSDLTEAIKDAFYVQVHIYIAHTCTCTSYNSQQECVPEDVKLKNKVFKQLDEVVLNDTVILASSTSCIIPTEFVSDISHKEQCIVAHPVSPRIW